MKPPRKCSPIFTTFARRQIHWPFDLQNFHPCAAWQTRDSVLPHPSLLRLLSQPLPRESATDCRARRRLPRPVSIQSLVSGGKLKRPILSVTNWWTGQYAVYQPRAVMAAEPTQRRFATSGIRLPSEEQLRSAHMRRRVDKAGPRPRAGASSAGTPDPGRALGTRHRRGCRAGVGDRLNAAPCSTAERSSGPRTRWPNADSIRSCGGAPPARPQSASSIPIPHQPLPRYAAQLMSTSLRFRPPEQALSLRISTPPPS